MKGVRTYTTAGGIRTAICHYSAHPLLDPDSPEGLARVRRMAARKGGMQATGWLQDMEIRFDVQGSASVWPDFLDRIQPKVTCEPFEVPEYWPVKAGYDYGYTNPFAFPVIAYESEQRFYQIDEIYLTGKDPYEQAKAMKEKPYWKRIQQTFADPNIWTRNQHQKNLTTGTTETRSIAAIFEDLDVYMTPGDNAVGCDLAFRDLLNSVLWRDLENPQFVIFSHCANTLRELRQLRYKEWATKAAQEKSNTPEEIVSKHNHAWDALKYLLLATHAEAPERLGYPNGSWGNLMSYLAHMQRRKEMILG